MAGAMLVLGVVTPLKPPNEPRQFYPGGVRCNSKVTL